MKCPCKNCITLPACQNEDIPSLVVKCSTIRKYLRIVKTKITLNKEDGTVRKTIFSNHNSLVHKYKLIKVKKYIPHTFTID
jgi:hypothetical protein